MTTDTSGAGEGLSTGRMPRDVAAAIDARIEELIVEGMRFNDSLRAIARNCYFQGYRDAKGNT